MLLTSACVGTMDSLHSIKGQAPEDGSCEVTITTAYEPPLVSVRKVRGDFSLGYTAGGPFPPRVDVAAYCNGVKVKERRAIDPRRMGDIDLGTLAP